MLWIAIKGSVILATAFLSMPLLRHASSALRHLVWTAALAALILLLPLSRISPEWTPAAAAALAPSTPTPVQTAITVRASASQPARSGVPYTTLWGIGAALVAAYYLAGAARMGWIVRRARQADYAPDLRAEFGITRGVCLLESAGAPVPMAWGVTRPLVILPADARQWPAVRLRSVLLHELAHVARLDVLWQAIGQAACALFWFHPLVWVAARRQKQERERACDDGVLRRGVEGPVYAGHLMDLVRALGADRRVLPEAPAMADASDLESRVRALLDRAQARQPVSSRAALATCAAAIGVLLPLAAVSARAQGARGAIVGVVQDPSGARVPGCRVTARNLDGANQETAACDAIGEYKFGSIPAGRYAITIAQPGFVPFKSEVSLVAGATARNDAHLTVGEIQEAVTVRGSRTAPAPVPQTARDQERIRVGGNVQASRIVRQPKAVYPEELKRAGVEGIVTIKSIVSKLGELINPQVVNTDIDPRFAQAALDAVRQWRYTPALLNGMPIETLTTIQVTFELDK